MIIGIGIDSVEVKRFAHWHTKSHTSLERVFSAQEIMYCLSVPAKSAERFAARFAAKEAFFKAVQPLCKEKMPLLTLCRSVEIRHTPTGMPEMHIIWTDLNVMPENIPGVLLTCTHTSRVATAVVILERVSQ